MPESYEIPSRAKAGTRFNNDTHVDLQMGRSPSGGRSSRAISQPTDTWQNH